MKHIFLIFSIILISISCQNKNINEIYFNHNDFPEQSTLTGEVIDFEHGPYPMNFIVIDTLIFVQNIKAIPHFYDIYGLKSKKHILSLAKEGKGPFEYLSCRLMHRSNHQDWFSIHDIVRRTTTRYHIDSLILFKDSYKPKRYQLPSIVKDYTFVNADSILAYNHYYFQERSIQNKAEPIVSVNLNNLKSEEAYIGKSKFYTYNVSGAFVLYHPDHEFVLLAYHYKDLIEFYDKQFRLVKQMRGPDITKQTYRVEEDNMVSSKDGLDYNTYNSVVVTKNAIYLAYAGTNGVSYDQPIGKPMEIFKISWEGELLKHYQLDRVIFEISISEDEQILYGTDIGYFNLPADDMKFVKYKLNKGKI